MRGFPRARRRAAGSSTRRLPPAMTTFSASRSCLLPLFTAAAALAAPLAAQNCLAGDFGNSLGYGTSDTVYAIRPIGFAFPFAGATYTDIHVNDHGFVQLSNGGVPAPLTSGSASLYTPTLANFQTGGPKIAPLYSDMTLQGGGECWLKSTPTQCTVTWHNAQSFGIPSPRFSFQLILESNGAIRFVYGPGCTNNSTYGGVATNAIVGVTTAGSAAAPAASNLSNGGVSPAVTTYELFPAAGAFDLQNGTLTMVRLGAGQAYGIVGSTAQCAKADRYGVGCDSLGLGLTGLPSLGNAGLRLRAELVPMVAPVGLFAVGTAVVLPGIDLGPLFGMTGCSGYTNADLGVYVGTQRMPGPTGLSPVSYFNLPIPSSSALAGFVLSAQALAQSVANPGGLASSNGLRLELGFGAGPVAINPTLGMVPILPGTFAMGSLAGNPNEAPVHAVTLTRPFWMGKHEITQAQFQAVAGFNPSHFQGVAVPDAQNRPVEQVKWSEATAFCAALTASEAAAGRVPAGYQYRLPTEAEWEYCCRAGTTTEWNTGASLNASQANILGALGSPTFPSGQTAVVGSYMPNAWGLYDMHGNVQEWCLDAGSTYTATAATDPLTTGTVFGPRIRRDGTWFSLASDCRSAGRDAYLSTLADRNCGFRVVLAPIMAP